MDDNHAFTGELNIERVDDAEMERIIMTARESDGIGITLVFFPTLVIKIEVELAKIIRSNIPSAKRRLQIKVNLAVCMGIITGKFI